MYFCFSSGFLLLKLAAFHLTAQHNEGRVGGVGKGVWVEVKGGVGEVRKGAKKELVGGREK